MFARGVTAIMLSRPLLNCLLLSLNRILFLLILLDCWEKNGARSVGGKLAHHLLGLGKKHAMNSRKALAELIRVRGFPVNTGDLRGGPLWKEIAWLSALHLMGYGGAYTQSLPLNAVEHHLKRLPTDYDAISNNASLFRLLRSVNILHNCVRKEKNEIASP